ncbi:hypothetical protein OHO28_49830 [Streptomyces europaeiscabiei]|uniref:hypothetical protein n=1 Tax=Streptomyces europaeiscabiei TaxID=146819 RepID=UPI002E17FA49
MAGLGGDVGVAVLAVDADGEVARAGHDARETTDTDFGVVLAERAVADVVQQVSIFRCPLIQSASRVPVTAPGGRLVIRQTRSTVSLPLVKSFLQRTT